MDPLRSLIVEIVREELARQRDALGADGFLTTFEAAERARVTQGTVRRWIAEGRLTSHVAGRVLRVRIAELDKLMTPGRKRLPSVARRVVKERRKSMEELVEEVLR